MTTALEGGQWSAARPGRTLPPGKTRYPLYRRLGGPQGRSGQAENLAPPGFDPRTVQPVVSRYTDVEYGNLLIMPANGRWDLIRHLKFKHRLEGVRKTGVAKCLLHPLYVVATIGTKKLL